MQKLQSLVGESARMVTLTADPEFDTPEVLKRYGKQYEANPERWWFLTGNRKEIYRLAIEDLKFTVLETGTPGGKLEDLFIHSANFVIVDRHGNLRAVVQSEDVNAEEEVVRVLQDLRYQP
jgi:protein SCO1/2